MDLPMGLPMDLPMFGTQQEWDLLRMHPYTTWIHLDLDATDKYIFSYIYIYIYYMIWFWKFLITSLFWYIYIYVCMSKLEGAMKVDVEGGVASLPPWHFLSWSYLNGRWWENPCLTHSIRWRMMEIKLYWLVVWNIFFYFSIYWE